MSDFLRVIFVRHGESESNLVIHNAESSVLSSEEKSEINRNGDPKLTARGKNQAQKTAQHLSMLCEGANAVHVYVSPFKRTLETATPFLVSVDFSKLILETDTSLQEYTRPSRVISQSLKDKYNFINDVSFGSFCDRVKMFSTTASKRFVKT